MGIAICMWHFQVPVFFSAGSGAARGQLLCVLFLPQQLLHAQQDPDPSFDPRHPWQHDCLHGRHQEQVSGSFLLEQVCCCGSLGHLYWSGSVVGHWVIFSAVVGHFYLSGSAVVGPWVVFTGVGLLWVSFAGEGLLLWVIFAGEGLLLLVRESFLMDRVSCYGSLGRFYLSGSAVVRPFCWRGSAVVGQWSVGHFYWSGSAVLGLWVNVTGVGLLYWVIFTGAGLLLWVSGSFLLQQVCCSGSEGHFYWNRSAVVGQRVIFTGPGLLKLVVFTGAGLLL